MKLFFCSLFAFFCVIANIEGQKLYLQNPIFLDINDQYVSAFDKADSSVATNKSSDSSKLIRVFNFNTMGGLGFLLLDNKGHVRVKGQYIESLPLKSENIKVKRLNGKAATEIRVFYKPSRQGDWLYYDNQGKIYLTEKYIMGKMIERSKVN